MPVRNVGTLLENIVLVESARLVLEQTREHGELVDFVNSFAMAPLTPWLRHANESRFDEARIAACVRTPGPPTTYSSLLALCCAPDSQLGPNGALLVGLLARHLGVPMRFWLNDLANGARYPGTMASLQSFDATLARLDPQGPAPTAVITCGASYPGSLPSLQMTLDQWCDGGQPPRRIGYLDPDRYQVNGAGGPQTGSADHRQWLRLLRSGGAALGVSVHFSGHRDWATLRLEIDRLRQDAADEGYLWSLTVWHSYYTTTISLFYAEAAAANGLRAEFENRIRSAWAAWCLPQKPLKLSFT